MALPIPIESEIGYTSVDLTPLFTLASLAAKAYVRRENIRESADYAAWGTLNSPIEAYNAEYSHVSEGQKIEERLDEVIREKGNAVCIIVGTDDNPLETYMRKQNQGGVQRLTVITVGLQERYSQEQVAEAEALGHYALATTIGAPEGFAQLHGLMDRLRAEGKIPDASADVVVTRLFGGWRSIPFEENLTHIVNKTQNTRLIGLPGIDQAVWKEQVRQSIHAEAQLDKLTEEELTQLFRAYEGWLIRSFQGLLQKRATVFGEIPYMLYERFARIVKPHKLYTQRIPGVLAFNAYAVPEDESYTFRLDMY